MFLDASGSLCIQLRNSRLKHSLYPREVESRKSQQLERGHIPHWVLLARRRKIPLSALNLLLHIRIRSQSTELVDGHPAKFCCGNGCLALPECSIVRFNLRNEVLKLLMKRDALRAQNQLVQVLAVINSNDQPRIDVLINEHIVEHHHVCESPTPSSILKHRSR
jgi:hypothetical protein